MANRRAHGIEYYLKTLELNQDATPRQIKQAYRNLAKVWHPDRFQNENETLKHLAQEKLKEINQAYEYLRNYQPQTEAPPKKEPSKTQPEDQDQAKEQFIKLTQQFEEQREQLNTQLAKLNQEIENIDKSIIHLLATEINQTIIFIKRTFEDSISLLETLHSETKKAQFNSYIQEVTKATKTLEKLNEETKITHKHLAQKIKQVETEYQTQRQQGEKATTKHQKPEGGQTPKQTKPFLEKVILIPFYPLLPIILLLEKLEPITNAIQKIYRQLKYPLRSLWRFKIIKILSISIFTPYLYIKLFEDPNAFPVFWQYLSQITMIYGFILATSLLLLIILNLVIDYR